MQKPKKDPILMLAEYWLSAEYMRLLTHDLKDHWMESPQANWPKFRTYAAYWLSGLYVVAEGFKELKLRPGEGDGTYKRTPQAIEEVPQWHLPLPA